MGFEQDHQQCLEKLVWATEKLKIAVKREILSDIGELIVQTMTGPWRYFHTPEHIFEVGGSEYPLEVLAALFHDVVYVQVDGSVNFNLSYYITPFVKEQKEHLYIRPRSDLPQERNFEIIMDLFRFIPGQQLSPFAGQNEFLSAIVAVKTLESFLPLKLLIPIIACIEATIPFRGKSPDGLTAIQILYQDLQTVNQKYQVGLSDQELIDTVKSAVRLANRDVGSFAYPSAAQFLDGTWYLLPETNHNLHNRSSYTVSEYRLALQKMEGFMNLLKPEVIFQKFQDEPDDARYQNVLNQAERNLAIARLYLGSKLCTIAFLEALSLRIGRDIPLSNMMGELPQQDEEQSLDKLIDLIPEIPNSHHLKDDIEAEVLELLEKGRSQQSAYDLKNSPLTTYMVKSIGFDEMRRQREQSQQFFQKKITAEAFLAQCDRLVIDTIIEGISQLFDRRKKALYRHNSSQV
jgi:hypothetical protein